jgi:dihydropteroate synthase
VGILNVTPDSFSDGGRYLDPGAAIARAAEIQEQGAAVLEIGAESSRPGAEEVPVEEEWRRLEPVLEAIISRIRIPVSVDTRRGATARRALELGAEIINDVSGGEDAALLAAVAEAKAALVLMHRRGGPADMMARAHYQDVGKEVLQELGRSVEGAVSHGVDPARLCWDPGFGFAKTPAHNRRLLADLVTFADRPYPLMAGLSRKRFLREIVGERPGALTAASVAAGLWAVARGANLLRVHDVEETAAALKAWLSLGNGVKNGE